MNQRNLSIDTLRLFAVFSVITLHINYNNLPKEYINNIRLLGRWAVPFFFVISGYYLGKKGSIPERALRKCLRLTCIFLFSSIIYLPVYFIQVNNILVYIESTFNPMFFMRGSYFHLWFINSMIIGHLIISVFYEYNLTILLYPLSVFLLFFALITDSYNFFNIPIDPVISRHLLSIPLIFVGIIISKNNSIKPSLSLVIAFLGVVLQFVESHFLWKYLSYNPWRHHFLLGTLLMTVGIAYIGINYIKIFSSAFLARLGQNYALSIYLIHPLIILILGKSAQITQLSEVIVYNILSPLIVLILSILALKICAKYFPSIFNLLNGNRFRTQITKDS
jgi:surface polysaccharide O-acyltransferase-like enzyme